MQTRYDDLIGIRVPLKALRQEMSGPSRVTRMNGTAKRPDWCKPWVWLASHNKYFNIETGSFASVQTFENTHGRDTPVENGVKLKAVTFVNQNGFIPIIAAPVYMPTETDRLLWVDGEQCVNTFNHSSLPVAAGDYTVDGSAYIDRVEAHIRMLCGSDDDAAILTQWLAHQVQFPGVKILWSPLIQSVEGVGKSFFARLLRCGLGVKNVGVVAPSQLTGAFNDWAAGVCVNVLEELKIAGHNRHEALNAVKPLITDDFIQVNPKGVNAYMTPNVCNYIAFTNAMDALPLGGSDRRWWIVQCRLRHYTDVPDHEAYFPALFDGLREHAGEVCLWLRNFEITDEFLNTKQAPMTTAKAYMVATEEASFEGLSETRDAIEEGGYLYNSECVSSADLFQKVTADHPNLFLHGTRRAVILKRLGYQSMGSRFVIEGKKKTFWTLSPMTTDEIRAKWPEKPPESPDFLKLGL